MKIFNNQKLHYDHLLSYTCSVKKEKWLELVDYMCRNMPVLNNTLNGFPIIVKQDENDDLSEILIPILENKNEIQTEFEYKHDFKIENALSVRCTGSIENIDAARKTLMEYIKKNSLNTESSFVYSVINVDLENTDNNIIDVYIICS